MKGSVRDTIEIYIIIISLNKLLASVIIEDTLIQRYMQSSIPASICSRLRILPIIYACSCLYHFSVCTDRLSSYRRPLQSNKH